MNNKEVSFSNLQQGSRSQITETGAHTIRNKADWQKFWERHSLNRQDAPKVDFRRNLVVGIFLGQQRTGGYSIEVDRIEDTGYDLLIYTKTTGPEGLTIQSFTQPFCFITMKKIKDREIRVGGLK
ncbi:MAG: protease complex subunit PrcB family protein [Candidatus Obscuribacterales bacterium]|nr:protease complex subunit PrcB family protein [Candidatus Obscuribacterales bacterium]